MAKVLHEQEMREILYGSTFLAGGGGGSLDDGLVMLEDNVKRRGEVAATMIDVSEMADNAYGAMIAGMGAPTVLMSAKEKFIHECGHTVDAMRHAAFAAGKSVDVVIPIEYGAVNCMIPLIACMERGLPLVDADGCGRAVPGLDVTMFDINGIPFAPAVVASAKGDIISVLPRDACDGKEAENICRSLCAVYGYVVGLGAWIASKQEIADKLILGTISAAQKVGKVILDTIAAKGNVAEALAAILPMRTLAQGTILKQENVMERAHDNGRTTVEDSDGKKFFVDIKNESLVFRSENEVLLTCPDMICALDLDSGIPVANANIREGMRVGYYALPAPDHWYATPAGVDCWKPYFEAVGYTGGIVRY